VNATDPSGLIAETAWDVFSLSVGVGSLGYNLRYGTWKDVGYDVLGIVADVAATLIPVIPGGAGVAIRATRLGARAADAVAGSATLQRSIKSVQLANLGANTIQGVESGVNAYNAYQDGRYTEAVFNGIGAGFAGLHFGTSAAGSAGRAARAFGGGFSAGFSETLGRQGARLYSAGGAAASGIEATANGLRRGVQNLAPNSAAWRATPGQVGRFSRTQTPWGRNVWQRGDIDWALKRPDGLTNLEAAQKGYAPLRQIGDGFEGVQLHHLNQDVNGGLAEVWASTHRRVNHNIPPPSWRVTDPDAAAVFRRETPSYWRWRANQMTGE
jgi:hypothetical protein